MAIESETRELRPGVFVKEVLRPGRYEKFDRVVDISEDDCRDYFASLPQLSASGLDVPLLYEHTDVGVEDGEGTPGDYNLDLGVVVVPRETDEGDVHVEAERLRQTVGRVLYDAPENRINERGGIDLVFEVPDPHAADQLRSGLIKFVSPELRPHWRDWKKRDYHKVFTHFALTHRPVQIDQRPGFLQLSNDPDKLSALSAPVQLSMAEISQESIVAKIVSKPAKVKPILTRRELDAYLSRFQLADDEEDEKSKKKPFGGSESEGEESESSEATPEATSAPEAPAAPAPIEEVNPDMPVGKESGDKKKLEALLAHLAKDGYALPADTDDSNLVDRLLTAAMTKNAVGEAEEDEEPEERAAALEESPTSVAQMSDGPKLDRHRRAVADRITSLQKKGILQKGVADKLMAGVGRLQFSDDGREIPAAGVTLGSFLKKFEGAASVVHPLLEDQTTDYSQLSDYTEGSHPAGDAFFKPANELTIPAGSPEAERAVNDLLRRHGASRRGGPAHTAVNASAIG